MPDKIVTLGGCVCKGTRFDSAGNVIDFEGVLGRNYTDLMRATVAARRKYNDQSISVLSVDPRCERYLISEESVRQNGTLIK